jgi:hypothetical protein
VVWEYVVLLIAILAVFAAWAAFVLGRVHRELLAVRVELMRVAAHLRELEQRRDRREPKTVSDRSETTGHNPGGGT